MSSGEIDPNREYDVFLRRYEHDTAVYEARFDTSRNLAAAHGSAALKILSVLNGGAVLAVPALTEVLNVVGDSKLAAASSIEIFCWGLIATALGFMFAYFMLETDCDAVLELMETQRKAKRIDYLRRVQMETAKISAIQTEIEKHERARSVKYRWVVALQIGAVSAAVCGFGAFIYGALTAKAMFNL